MLLHIIPEKRSSSWIARRFTMSNRTADQLLKWGIEHAPVHEDGTSSVAHVAADVAAGRRPDLADPGLYDAIMGKSEAQMMQEELDVAINPARTEEDRCIALDNFEMLIEQVDNANNMESLRMWPAVLALMNPEHTTPPIQVGAAWIVGTAVQNNDKAQAAAFSHGALPCILALLQDLSQESVCNKAVYALSAMLKHYPAAVHQFTELHGWTVLRSLLGINSLAVRRKVTFLLIQLLHQANDALDTPVSGPVAPKAPIACVHPPADEGPATMQHATAYPPVAQLLVDHGIIGALVDSVVPSEDMEVDAPTSLSLCSGTYVRDDDDYLEKVVQVLEALVSHEPCPSSLPKERLQQLAQYLLAADGQQPRIAALDVNMQALTAYLGR